jgi:SNF2 family DNA or RNA helicase
MLMSLKAGNLGLNMIVACHVIMLDPWWNPYAEDQAVDRAHRIGQTQPVTVTRFTVNETVEDRILALQVIFWLNILNWYIDSFEKMVGSTCSS